MYAHTASGRRRRTRIRQCAPVSSARSSAWRARARALEPVEPGAIVYPPLALRRFSFGGFAVGFLGLRALWRRWDSSSGSKATTMRTPSPRCAKRAAGSPRRAAARPCRIDPQQAGPARARRARRVRRGGGLRRSASELDDDELELDPAAAVACARLLEDFAASTLLNLDLPPEEHVSCTLRPIRSRVPPLAAPPPEHASDLHASAKRRS